jgi:hypothetical protein
MYISDAMKGADVARSDVGAFLFGLLRSEPEDDTQCVGEPCKREEAQL